MTIHFIKHCTEIKIRLVSDSTLPHVCGRCSWAKATNQTIFCKNTFLWNCHVERTDGARLAAGCQTSVRTLRFSVHPAASRGRWRHAADGVELALHLSAGVRQRGEAARGGGEDRSSAQTFSLSPEIKVRRHSAGASWGLLWERDHVSLQVGFMVVLHSAVRELLSG